MYQVYVNPHGKEENELMFYESANNHKELLIIIDSIMNLKTRFPKLEIIIK